MIEVKVLADSYNKETGDRLTTIEAKYPRVVHAELMTHRVFSRNAASSRAIPVSKMIEEVRNDPYIPRAFGLKQKGMQPKKFVTDGEMYQVYKSWWVASMQNALRQAEAGADLGLHKQIVNRILEPYQYMTTIVSATDWDNFIKLRTETDDNGNPMADIPIYDLALQIKTALDTHQPTFMDYGQWHIPFAGGEGWDELSATDQLRVAVARCARVSYKTHSGETDVNKDLALYKSLSENSHLSPMEHVATTTEDLRSANFSGFKSFRSFYEEGRIS
jgi:thymidylate synthase ThyX